MLKKTVFLVFAFSFCGVAMYAQQYRIEIDYAKTNKETKYIYIGDKVRLAYPVQKIKGMESLTRKNIGLSGQVSNISRDSIYLKANRKHAKQIVLSIKDLTAIKKTSSAGTILTFVASYVVVGGGAMLLVNSFDANPAYVAFAGAFSVFPAAIITGSVFYPSKPRQKVGEKYELKVVPAS